MLKEILLQTCLAMQAVHSQNDGQFGGLAYAIQVLCEEMLETIMDSEDDTAEAEEEN